MIPLPSAAVTGLLLAFLAQQAPNTWRDRLPDAREAATAAPTVANLRTALDVAYRADAWQDGLRLAELVSETEVDGAPLRGLIARAYWRAGRLPRAMEIIDATPTETNDRVALTMQVRAHLVRGRSAAARLAATRLEGLGFRSASEVYEVLLVHLRDSEVRPLARLLRRAEELADPANGYPDEQIRGALKGVADFLEQVGPRPVNRVTRFGSAPLPMISHVALPGCDAFINGWGPYRFILDTGGSSVVSLDQRVADEIGLRSLATASIRGVAGAQTSGQALISRLELGGVACERVLCRVFELPPAIAATADGLIGTGIFSDARMQLDFGRAALTIARSSVQPAAGQEATVWVIADGKLFTPVQVDGSPSLALLDTGAANVVALSMSRARRLFPDDAIGTLPPIEGIGIGAEGGAGLSFTPSITLSWAGQAFDNAGGMGLAALDDLLGPALGVQVDVLVGMPVFREMTTFTVDYPRCRMWIEWIGDPADGAGRSAPKRRP